MPKIDIRSSASISLALLAGLLVLPGCSPAGMAVGAGATVGVAAAKEGGLKRAFNDTKVRAQITDLWFSHDVEMYRRLSLTVTEGRVLVTGVVPNPDMRVDAIRLAWQAKGVEQVINEVQVDNGEGVKGYARDAWVTAKLRTKLTLDREVQSINYTVETVGGTVYVMGVAQDDPERQRVIDHARDTGYVREVVSYVRLRGETPPAIQTAAN